MVVKRISEPFQNLICISQTHSYSCDGRLKFVYDVSDENTEALVKVQVTP